MKVVSLLGRAGGRELDSVSSTMRSLSYLLNYGQSKLTVSLNAKPLSNASIQAGGPLPSIGIRSGDTNVAFGLPLSQKACV